MEKDWNGKHWTNEKYMEEKKQQVKRILKADKRRKLKCFACGKSLDFDSPDLVLEHLHEGTVDYEKQAGSNTRDKIYEMKKMTDKELRQKYQILDKRCNSLKSIEYKKIISSKENLNNNKMIKAYLEKYIPKTERASVMKEIKQYR